MNSRSRTLLLSTVLPLTSGALALLTTSGSVPHAGTTPAAKSEPAAVRPASDKPLPGFKSELIDIAFSTATKVPAAPHLKTRCRMQEEVAATCFELDQPRRALHYIENIADWRRGKGYADFAFYCAKHGDTSEVQHYLDCAVRVAESVAKEMDTQDWQVDRIRAAVAETYVLLGKNDEADDITAGAEEFETSKVEALKAERLDPAAFDTELDLVSGIVATGGFDQTQGALESCTRLFDRFYADVPRRTRAEEKIKTSWQRLPLMIRIDLMVELTQFALAHGDREKALSLLEESVAIMESAPWLPEDHIALMAKLTGLRARAGDTERARVEADSALALYEKEREKIENFRRGAALRPLAEAYQALGDSKKSLAVYKQAVEEGSLNPNARARAEDLTATCRSMALQGVAPDADLMARIHKIHDGLGDPW